MSDDEPPIDFATVRDALHARAERVTARVMERIAERRSLPREFRRSLARVAIPAILAAAASVAWLVTTKPAAPPVGALQGMLMTNRPVPLLELMVVMEDAR